jgi:hypothetical protein
MFLHPGPSLEPEPRRRGVLDVLSVFLCVLSPPPILLPFPFFTPRPICFIPFQR